MPAEPLKLNLDLALARVQADHRAGRAFFVHPYEMTLVAKNKDRWLAGIRDRLSAGSYAPEPAFVIDVPKGSGAIRTGVILSLSDQVVYTALVGSAALRLAPTLNWSVPPRDYGYQLGNLAGIDWLKKSFLGWDGFRVRSLALLDEAPSAIVSTDITGFYEHIDHELLMSDLRAGGVEREVIDLIGRCLSKWSIVNRRGLPQNVSASHVLAKLYLTRFDHAVGEAGFTHIRYVDDTRVFCATTAAAKRAIVALTALLRARGLTLQTAKTEILLPGDARDRFDGVNPVLKPLAKHYIDEIAAQVGLDPDYLTVTEAEELVMSGKADPPSDMLHDVFDAYFVKETAKFNKTLFHFILLRLGRAGDSFALGRALDYLETHPEETEWILSYITNVNAVAGTEAQILSYLESREAVYEYQVYQIVRWRATQQEAPSPAFVEFVRELSTAQRTAPFVLSVCRAFLGRFGSAADLDSLVVNFGVAASDLARAEIAWSLGRME